jgi:hypothetical protein
MWRMTKYRISSLLVVPDIWFELQFESTISATMIMRKSRPVKLVQGFSLNFLHLEEVAPPKTSRGKDDSLHTSMYILATCSEANYCFDGDAIQIFGWRHPLLDFVQFSACNTSIAVDNRMIYIVYPRPFRMSPSSWWKCLRPRIRSDRNFVWDQVTQG